MKRIVLALVVALFAVVVWAEESRFAFSPSPRFWGATLFLRYALEPPAVDQVETSLVAGVSAAYEKVGYYRNSDGTLYAGDAEAATYNRFDAYWQAGVQQGILPRKDKSDDLAVVFAYYRGRYDNPEEGAPVSAELLGSIHAGVAYSDIVDLDVLNTKRGLQAELVLQWGPPFLHNSVLGSADFTRTTLAARGFLPLYAAPPRAGRNNFSSYLAGFAAVDWATGAQVPTAVRSTLGLRSERSSVGGAVRGYEYGRFDATFKAVANAEVRMNLPAIVWPGLVPGIVVYTDAGYFNDLDVVSTVEGENSGTLLSSGIGLSIDIFDAVQFVFYSNLLWDQPLPKDSWNQVDLGFAYWQPFTLGFGFHF